MVCAVLRQDSLVLETSVLTLAWCYLTILVAMSAIDASMAAGLLLVIAACAYGIPVSNVDNVHARNMSLFTVIAAVSGVVVFVGRGIYIGANTDPRVYQHLRNPSFAIGFFVGVLFYVVAIGLTGFVAIKHIRNIRKPMSRMEHIPMTTEVIQAPYYQPIPNQVNFQAAQPLIGQPTYVYVQK